MKVFLTKEKLLQQKRKILAALRDLGRTLAVSAKRFYSGSRYQRALALTYYTVFSIVPLLALFFGIAKGFSFEKELQQVVNAKFTPQHEVIGHLCGFAEVALRESSGSLVAGIGVLVLFWAVWQLISNVENAFFITWGVRGQRSLWRKFANYLTLTLVTPILLVAVSTAGMMFRSKISGMTGFHPMLVIFVRLAPLLLICAILTLIYRCVPRTQMRFRSALIAGIFAGIAYLLLQSGFVFVQGWVFGYNRVYGSFAVIPLFLIWLNWSWQIILFGAEISFVHQNLHSGIFEVHRIREMNLRVRREHQLAITHLVFRHFIQGGGALSMGALLQTLHLPEFFLQDELQELIDRGILCRALENDREPCVLPAVPTEKLTVAAFLGKLTGTGDPDEFPDASRCFDQMEKELAKGAGSRLVRDLES